jgi:transcriptional regulator with XRE-family HTH domain
MNNLQLLRLQKKLSQRDLAKILKLHPSTINRVERGWFAKPPDGLEKRLQAVFGKEWTFARLMEPVPDLMVKGPDAA